MTLSSMNAAYGKGIHSPPCFSKSLLTPSNTFLKSPPSMFFLATSPAEELGFGPPFTPMMCPFSWPHSFGYLQPCANFEQLWRCHHLIDKAL
jgi:hypothetical protein